MAHMVKHTFDIQYLLKIDYITKQYAKTNVVQTKMKHNIENTSYVVQKFRTAHPCNDFIRTQQDTDNSASSQGNLVADGRYQHNQNIPAKTYSSKPIFADADNNHGTAY